MIVNRKLFWIDMVLLACVLILIFLKPGKLSDALTGGVAALFVISLRIMSGIIYHSRNSISSHACITYDRLVSDY